MVARCGRAMALGQLAYTAVVCCVGALLLLSLVKSGQDSYQVVDALALNEELEFAAIKGIHGQLDDNADGTVDFQESEEFLQTELHEGSEKSQRFHETDQEITSEDLWKSWHENRAFNWSSDDVLSWLETYVELPQYSEVFKKHNITGRHLPRIANNVKHVLQMVLQISDSQHKQKIKLRAMDVVLFGPPNGAHSGYWKDMVVLLSSSLCLLGLLYALRQRHSAQTRIDAFLESIRIYERELNELKERLEQQKEEAEMGDSPHNVVFSSEPDSPNSEEEELAEECFSSSCTDSLLRAQEEIQLLRDRMWSLESQLLATGTNNHTLQTLLQEAYQREWEHLEGRKKNAEEEMTNAQRVCDKIKRRRSSLFGSFHLANSSALEDAGMQITKAVNKMQKMSENFDEYRSRWKKIEQVCGFPITSPSPPHTRHPSMNHQLDLEVSELCFDSHQNQKPRSQYGSVSSLASSDSLSYGRDSPLLVGHPSVLPTGRRKSNSVPSITPLPSPSSTHALSHRPQTAASQDSGISQDSNYVDFSPASVHQPLVPVSSLTNQQGHENGTYTFRSFHRSASTPHVRKSSYPKLVNTTSSGTNYHTDGDIGITFLDPERSPKSNSGGWQTRRTNILGAIQEERSPPLTARTHRQQSNGLDSVGEESDGSGSDRTKRSSSLKKNRKPSGQVKCSRSNSN